MALHNVQQAHFANIDLRAEQSQSWAQIPKKNAAESELNLRESLHAHRISPPAVPDDHLDSSRRKIQVESGNENKHSKKTNPKRKDTDKSESSFVTPEFPVLSGDSAIDAAKSYMALYDSQVRQRLSITRAVDKDETDIYREYSTPIEISDDLDKISTVAQRGVKTYADDRELGVDEKFRKDQKDQSRNQKQKERAHYKSRRLTSYHFEVCPSVNGGILPNASVQASSLENGSSLLRTSEVSEPGVQNNDADDSYAISDPRNDLKITTPLCSRVLEREQLKPKMTLEPKSTGSPSRNEQNCLFNSIQDTFGGLIDLSDDSNISLPTNQAFLDGKTPSKYLGSRITDIDLLSGDLEDLKIDELERPSNQNLQDETPRGTSDEIAQLVTAKLLAALRVTMTAPLQSANAAQSEYKDLEAHVVVDNRSPEDPMKANIPAIGTCPENDTTGTPETDLSLNPTLPSNPTSNSLPIPELTSSFIALLRSTTTIMILQS
ncbi:hypothetical protein EYC80_002788 [Monilinia laxa]|uniref:Uncharacterized protein n=1 Tax=Monilinia laxa TaxID=61186 RepID=A0A5N6KBQ2_MONLA|nr:hypothetical protein EYC80_002788 [Monilinia laxa]